MNVIQILFLALSMSADSFAASIGRGVALKNPSLKDAFYIALIFAVVQTITPIVGWIGGLAAKDFITNYDHWAAFVILVLVGLKMFVDSLSEDCEEISGSGEAFLMLVAIAFGTSIDAMVVGVTFALVPTNVFASVAAIGGMTFIASTVGILAGKYVGCKCGKIAETLGGVVLMGLGAKILLEHLGYI